MLAMDETLDTTVGAVPAPDGTERKGRPVAVALARHPVADVLPRVVASGHGRTAEQILELAFANGVKVRQDADLAEVLAAVDIDADIPVEAIVAVAEILTHVYRANGRMALAEEPK